MIEMEYTHFWFCHTCGKYLKEEFVGAHKHLNHTVEKYLSVPKPIEPIKIPEIDLDN